jgi:hypothetical protein
MSSLSLGVRADADPDVRAFVVRFWADVHDRATALPCAIKVAAAVAATCLVAAACVLGQ